MKKILFTLCFFAFFNPIFAQDLNTTEIIVIEGFKPEIPDAVKINKQASFSDTTKIDKSQKLNLGKIYMNLQIHQYRTFFGLPILD